MHHLYYFHPVFLLEQDKLVCFFLKKKKERKEREFILIKKENENEKMKLNKLIKESKPFPNSSFNFCQGPIVVYLVISILDDKFGVRG